MKLLLIGLGGLFKIFAKTLGFVLQPALWVLDKLIGSIKWVLSKGLGVLESAARFLLPEDLKDRIGLVTPQTNQVDGVTGAQKTLTDNLVNTQTNNAKSEILLKVQQPEGFNLLPEFLIGGGDVEVESGRGMLLPASG